MDYDMPDLRNFSTDEYLDMKSAFEKKGKPQIESSDIIANRMNAQLTYESLEFLIDESAASVPLMAFLISYVKN